MGNYILMMTLFMIETKYVRPPTDAVKSVIFSTYSKEWNEHDAGPWDILCSVMGSTKLSDFPQVLARTVGMRVCVCVSLSMRVCVFPWVFVVCHCGGGAVLSWEGKSEQAHC